MAANKEISISSDDLSKEGYSALAVKTPDNKLDASRLDTEAVREEAKKLAEALKNEKSTIQGVTADDLQALLEEAEITETEEPKDNREPKSQEDDSEKGGKIPTDIKSSADTARAQIKSTFGNVSDKDYASHLSSTRAMVVKWIPGLEVSSVEDISDALYQSDIYINKLVDYLEQQSGDTALYLSFGVTDSYNPINALGMIWGKITGEDEKKFAPGLYPSTNIEFKTIEEKQEYIGAMLQKINAVMKGRKPGEWISTETAQDAGWIAFVALGGYVGGKIAIGTFNAVMNKLTFGFWSKGTTGIFQGDPDAINKAKKVGGIAQKVWGMRPGAKPTPTNSPTGPHGAPAATPSTTPSTAPTAVFRELDVAKPIEKIVHEGILRELYNQEVTSGTRAGPALGGADPIPQNFVDEVKNGIDPAKTAEYQSRVMRYQSLGNAPIGDAGKLQVWQSEVERAIRGEKDPSKWNLKAKSVIKASVGTNATALSSRLAAAHAASQTETIRIGADEFKVDPRTKTALNEVKNLEEQIAEKETKKAELEASKQKLEARLALEVEYGRIQARLAALPGEITLNETNMNNAKVTMNAHNSNYLVPAEKSNPTGRKILDTASRDIDPSYINDKADYDKKKGLYETAVAEQKRLAEIDLPGLDTKVRQITGKPLSDMTRLGTNNMIFTASGKLRSSLTFTQYQAPRTGVLAQISTITGEITALEGQLNARMATLNGIISGIPNAWNKLGIDIRMPDGTIERVTKISDLFARLVKASVKK